MALSIKLTTLLLATVVCYFTRSQAAPLNISDGIVRNTRAEAVTPTVWMQDMYDCWDTEDAETCERVMRGVRSSRNSTIPAADIVEMILTTTVEEDPTPTISYAGSKHFIEFTFNVSAMQGSIQKAEVRIYHSAVPSAVSCNTKSGVLLNLLAVNAQNQGSVIDNVTVHLDQDNDKWIVFDSMKYDWKFEQGNVHKLAVAVSGACSNVELNKLGFVVDVSDQDKLPLLAVFTLQERMMTEVKLLPTALVNALLQQSADGVEQKRSIEKKSTSTCHFQEYTVNLRQVGLRNILRPEVLKLNYCTGSCQHPVAHNSRNSVYAFLKAQIAHLTGDLEDPSCVPISYRRQPIMYTTPSGDTMRIMDAEASAVSCGCR